MELLNTVFPNLMQKLPEFYQAIIDTFVMVGISGSISFILGIIFGVVLIVTKPGGILERHTIYQVVDKSINHPVDIASARDQNGGRHWYWREGSHYSFGLWYRTVLFSSGGIGFDGNRQWCD